MPRRAALLAAAGRANATGVGGGPGPGGPGVETFTALDGTLWPSDWAAANGAGATQTIQGNKGRLVPASGWAAAWRETSTAFTDFDLTLSFKTGSGLVSVGMAPAFTAWVLPDNAHYVRFEPGASEMGYVSLRRHSAGAHTELSFVYSGAAVHATNGWQVRFQRVGSTVRVRVWTAGGAEPGTWLLETADGSPPSPLAAKVFLGCDTQTDFDNVSTSGGSAGSGGSGFGVSPFGAAPFGV